MKTQDTVSRNKGGFSMERWRKLYVSAVEAPLHHEDVVDTEPSSNLARIFVVLLLIHVFLVGAIVLYNVFADHGRGAALDSNPSQAKTISSTSPAVAVSSPSKTSPSAAGAGNSNQAVHHTVVAGDSLASISQNFGVDQNSLIQANHIGDSNPFRMDMDLTIPTKNPATPPATKTNPPASRPATTASQSKTTSQQGNSKSQTKVADTKKSSTPVTPPPAPVVKNDPPAASQAHVYKAIPIQGNPPSSPVIVDAPLSAVPVQDAPPQTKPGDRIQSGSSTPAPKIASQDNPPSSKTKSKDDKADADAKSKADTKAKTDAKKTRYHIVAEDETLTSIAKKFKVKVSTLIKANNLGDSHKIREGMKLKIPAAPKTTTGSGA